MTFTGATVATVAPPLEASDQERSGEVPTEQPRHHGYPGWYVSALLAGRTCWYRCRWARLLEQDENHAERLRIRLLQEECGDQLEKGA